MTLGMNNPLNTMAAPDNDTRPARAPRIAHPVLWLVMLIVSLGLTFAVDLTHPQGTLIAAGLGLAALTSLIMAAWSVGRRGRTGAADGAWLKEIDASPDGVLITDAAGHFVFASAAFHTLLSYAGDDTPARRVPSLVAVAEKLGEGEGAEDLRRLIARVLDGSDGHAEFAVKRGKATAWRRITARHRGAPGAKGQARIHWRVEDITDAREIESVRADEQHRLADFIDNLPVGFFSADADGVIRYANQTLARWLGVPPDRLTGTPFADYVAEVGDDGQLTLKDGEGRPFDVALEQSQMDAPDGDIAYTRSVVFRDIVWREPVPVAQPPEQAPEPTDEPSPAEGGGEPGVIAERLRWLFDEAPVGMVILDLSGTITDANRAFLKLLGRHREAVLGEAFAERISKEDRGDVTAALSKIVMGTARATHMEIRMPGAGAHEFTISLYASRLGDAAGEVTGIVLYLVNATEQKNLEVQFAQSQKMQAVGQLAGGVAHDFNNLLTAMIGFCDLLLTRHGPDDPSFADIQQIRQNANRATNLVRQLLAFSRMQTLQPVRLDVGDALSDLSNLVSRLIGETVTLEMEHGRDLWAVRGDRSQFDQIIINLCVNARDAMPGGGEIAIRTQNVTVDEPIQRGHDLMPVGQYVRIDVSDTGTGISKENMERIFDPFFTTKEAGAGTGLGLSTVYGIVHQTDGFIFVDSAPGEGTTFSIYLPRFADEAEMDAEAEAAGAEDDAAAPAAADEVLAEGDLTGQGTVLLVEDEDAVRMFGARALKNKGYTVLEASNGETALDVINATDEKIDIIVSDVIMPGMDGHTLVGLVRQEMPDVKVILMSGYAEDMIEEIGRDDTLHFLGKPFTLKDLAAKVKDVLAG